MQSRRNGRGVLKLRASAEGLALLLGLLIALQAPAERTSTPLDGAWHFQRADVGGAEAPAFGHDGG